MEIQELKKMGDILVDYGFSILRYSGLAVLASDSLIRRVRSFETRPSNYASSTRKPEENGRGQEHSCRFAT